MSCGRCVCELCVSCWRLGERLEKAAWRDAGSRGGRVAPSLSMWLCQRGGISGDLPVCADGSPPDMGSWWEPRGEGAHCGGALGEEGYIKGDAVPAPIVVLSPFVPAPIPFSSSPSSPPPSARSHSDTRHPDTTPRVYSHPNQPPIGESPTRGPSLHSQVPMRLSSRLAMSPTFEYEAPLRSPSSSSPTSKRYHANGSTQYGKYSPSSRPSDIPRILDSSYSSSTSSSPTSFSIDQQGALHDPDYRDFPAIVAPSTRRRPAWERAGFASDDDDDAYLSPDEDLDEDTFDERSRLRSASPRERRRRSLEARYPAYHTASTYSSPYYSRNSLEEYSRPSIVDESLEKKQRRKLRSKVQSQGHVYVEESAWAQEVQVNEPEGAVKESTESSEEYISQQIHEAPEWT